PARVRRGRARRKIIAPPSVCAHATLLPRPQPLRSGWQPGSTGWIGQLADVRRRSTEADVEEHHVAAVVVPRSRMAPQLGFLDVDPDGVDLSTVVPRLTWRPDQPARIQWRTLMRKIIASLF